MLESFPHVFASDVCLPLFQNEAQNWCSEGLEWAWGSFWGGLHCGGILVAGCFIGDFQVALSVGLSSWTG